MAVDFALYLITDRHQLPSGRTLPETVTAALRGGVRAVQLREKDLPAAQLLPLARELREATHQYGARLLINDRLDIALAVGADGVHLGGHSMPTAEARRLLGEQALIGVSTHREEEIRAAAQDGADFVTFGPVYATPAKLPLGEPCGLETLEEACRLAPLPVFALGGITAQRAAAVRAVGAAGIALISAIIAAPDPYAAARAFLA